ncbi:MAG TPA: S9 family peptidase, partial [Xanthobacteraceae bacterium]|nr:S9 family peptidase [Xanthobacteraceae bacterium]
MLTRSPQSPPEPHAPQREHTSRWHGVELRDEFAWLRAANWQEVMRNPDALDPEIRAYLVAENAYADAVLADTAELQAALFGEMKGRIKEDDSSVPTPDGPYAYFSRHREGGEHPLICRKPRDGEGEEILLDGDALAQGKAFFQLDGTRHSPDHRYLAWSADEAGSEFNTLRVRNLATGAELSDVLPDVSGAPVWTADAAAFYYVRLDPQHRPTQVFRHKLGTAASEDVLVFEAGEPGFFVSVSEVQSGRFAVISMHDHETSECRLIDLSAPDAVPTLVAARETGVQYDIEHHPALDGEPSLVIRTNADGAEDFKI